MSRGSPRRSRLRLLTAALCALLATSLLPALAATAAPPRTAAEAATQAEELRTRVDALTVEAEQASEDYNDAHGRLGSVVTAHLLAQRQLDAALRRAGAGRTAADDRARRLYMTGSPLALYTTVLDGADLHDVLSRLEAVRGIVGSDRARGEGLSRYASEAARIEARLATLTTEQRTLEVAAAASATGVTSRLAEVERLLSTADAVVVRLAESERQAAVDRAAADFAARLLAAQAAADTTARAVPAGGPGGTLVGGVTVSGPVAPNPLGVAAVAAARAQIGKPYLWGATGPGTFDCSGLTGWAYDQAGLRLPRTSRQQFYAGPHVALADLAPGDLLFWADDVNRPATIHHVSVYVGGGRMIAAARAGTLVREQAVYSNGYIGAVRPVAAAAAGVAGPAWS